VRGMYDLASPRHPACRGKEMSPFRHRRADPPKVPLELELAPRPRGAFRRNPPRTREKIRAEESDGLMAGTRKRQSLSRRDRVRENAARFQRAGGRGVGGSGGGTASYFPRLVSRVGSDYPRRSPPIESATAAGTAADETGPSPPGL